MSKSLVNATANPNVPANVLVLYESSAMSGEITTTHYVDANGCMWVVGDWKIDKPAPQTLSEICRASGLWESVILASWKSWRKTQAGVAA